MNMHEKTTRCGRAHWLFSLLLCAAIGLSAGGAVSPAAADDDDDGRRDNGRQIEIVEPGRTLFGKSYNRLAGSWGNWLQKEPPGTNPAFDPDGRFCDLNQKGRIWYLAGTFGGVADRFCEVPAGKGILFPIIANVSFAPDFLNEPPCEVLAGEVDQVRCDVTDDTPFAPNVGLEATLDGEPVADLFGYRVQSPPGGFTFRLGPLFAAFGLPPGDRFPAVVDGYWILLKPLPRGLHSVSFSADFDLDGIPDSGANYDLLVVGDDDD